VKSFRGESKFQIADFERIPWLTDSLPEHTAEISGLRSEAPRASELNFQLHGLRTSLRGPCLPRLSVASFFQNINPANRTL
jgi:hypothetical protein